MLVVKTYALNPPTSLVCASCTVLLLVSNPAYPRLSWFDKRLCPCCNKIRPSNSLSCCSFEKALFFFFSSGASGAGKLFPFFPDDYCGGLVGLVTNDSRTYCVHGVTTRSIDLRECNVENIRPSEEWSGRGFLIPWCTILMEPSSIDDGSAPCW